MTSHHKQGYIEELSKMFYYKEELINQIVPDKPDPTAAKVLQVTLGGRFGEMRTMMQFSFQSANFRGKAKQYRDLIRGMTYLKCQMNIALG